MESMVEKGNVLITGGTGFIGTNLVEAMLKENYEVYVLAMPTDFIGIQRLKLMEKVHVITDSVKEMIDIVDRFPQFDLVYHLASYGVDITKNNIELMCDVNIKMLGTLIDFCKLNKSRRLINTGSCFEYGDSSERELHEVDQCKPQSLYACSKQAAFIMMNTYAKQKNVEMITIRPFGVYGIHEASFRLVPQVMRCGIEQKKLDLTKGEQVRDFMYVKDLAEILIKVGNSDAAISYEVYNICTGHPCRVVDFVKEIIEVCSFDPSLYDFGKLPYRENESMYFIGDNQKLKTIINFDMAQDHHAGILETYEWMKGVNNARIL